jgi:hypothetical protein
MEISRSLLDAMVNSRPRPTYVKSSTTIDEFAVTEVSEPVAVDDKIVDKFPGLKGVVNVTLEGERYDDKGKEVPAQPVVIDCGTLFQALNEGGIPPEENKKTKKIVIPDFTIAINAGKVTCSPKA